MATHMKTTVDLPNPLLAEAKAEAARQGTTLRCLIEEGLRFILRERRKPAVPYRMKDGSVHGGGLTPEFEAKGGWSKIREAAYPGFFDEDDNDPDRGFGESLEGADHEDEK
jgi:hypothetical protein